MSQNQCTQTNKCHRVPDWPRGQPTPGASRMPRTPRATWAHLWTADEWVCKQAFSCELELLALSEQACSCEHEFRTWFEWATDLRLGVLFIQAEDDVEGVDDGECVADECTRRTQQQQQSEYADKRVQQLHTVHICRQSKDLTKRHYRNLSILQLNSVSSPDSGH